MRILKWILIVVVLVSAAGAAGAWWYWQRLVAFGTEPVSAPRELVLEVAPKTGPKAVSEKLAASGLVTDGETFYRWLRWVKRAAGTLRSGEYGFSAGQSSTPEQLLARLQKGEVLSVKVTIPEGLRIEEQAGLFVQSGLPIAAAEYSSLARSKSFVKQLGVEAESLEGYLFPDTYLVPRTTDAAAMLKIMVERWRRAWDAAVAKVGAGALTQRQTVTLASIVEKETGQAQERPRISCVFHNRLKKDMKLQTDPTVIYSVILRTGRFDGNLRRSDLDTPHPYNTYAVKGLPPGPIANAGQAALEAAIAPITCEDLFFVSRNDGTHVFCPTLACHEAAVEKWQREYFRKKRAGGGE